MRTINLRKRRSVLVIILFVGLLLSGICDSSTVCAQCTLFYDDFEDGTLDKWNVVLGTWEVIPEGDNLVAHLTRSSTRFRRMVSIASVPGDMILTAEVKGDCDPIDDTAYMVIGFWSTSDGSSFYMVGLGCNDLLFIGRFENNWIDVMCYYPNIQQVNNQWYHVKIELEGTRIDAKIWEDGGSEPPDWQISWTDETPYGNHLVLGGITVQHDEEFWFDEIAVDTSCDAIPTLTEWGMIIFCALLFG